MKKITSIFLFCALVVAGTFAQAPQKFRYQAVARDAANAPYANTNLRIRFSILEDNDAGTVRYSEYHDVTTTPLGLFEASVGNGTIISGSMLTVNWGAHPYYLKVELNPAPPGGAFLPMGVSQLLSVPYALYAQQSGSDQDQQTLSLSGNQLSISNGNSVTVDGSATNEIQNISIAGNVISLSNGGGSITLPPSTGTDAQSLSISGNQLSISNGNTVSLPAEVDGSTTNEIQSLTLSGNTLSLSNGGGSVSLPSGTSYTAGAGISISGATISNTGDTNAADDLTNASLAAGDVTGAFNNLQISGGAVGTPEIANGAVTGSKIAQAGATPGQVLKWNGASWTPANDDAGGGGFTLPISQSVNLTGPAIEIINTGGGSVIEATASGNNTVGAVIGVLSATNPATPSAGVVGFSNSPSGAANGVWGEATGEGAGVLGTNLSGDGVVGRSNDGDISSDHAAVKGLASSWAKGVMGISAENTGIEARSTNGDGLYAESENAHALHAYSVNAEAAYFESVNGPAIITAPGNAVGIGVFAPDAVLDVVSPSLLKIADFNGPEGLFLALNELDNYRGYIGSYSGNPEDVDFGTGSGNTSGKVHLTIEANPALTVDAQGRVGIGTTEPNAKMHVAQFNAGSSMSLYTNQATGHTLVDGLLVGVNSTGEAMICHGENQPILFETNFVERMRIQGNGSVGIGNSNPGSDVLLTVGNDATNKVGAVMGRINSTGNATWGVNLGAGAGVYGVSENGWGGFFVQGGGANSKALHTTGDVEFNLSAVPGDETVRFDFNGSIRDFIVKGGSLDPIIEPSEHEYGILGVNGKALYSIDSRSFYASTPSNYFAYSDERIKEKIRPYAGALDQVMKLKPVQYDLKSDYFNQGRKGKPEAERLNEIGFLAQDIEKVFPKLVQDRENGMKAVGYMGLIPVLTAAMQEQQKTIDAQKAEIADLRTELQELKAAVKALMEK
ncbi:MAG: tail fiber domain-containing protein [Saprospiraceae bacterium]|nr:tail fiber domain-containing protein [Saprospiraceae bacterium]